MQPIQRDEKIILTSDVDMHKAQRICNALREIIVESVFVESHEGKWLVVINEPVLMTPAAGERIKRLSILAHLARELDNLVPLVISG